jgi:thiol-disulfide isomerase/thioredoxin
MSQGAWVLVAALALAGAFGLYRAARDGRFRGTHRLPGPGPGGSAARGPVRGVVPEPAAAEGATPDPAGSTDRSAPSLLDGLDHDLGERATLLQFSSAFCAPCRVTRRVLAEVASVVPGVTHVEVDAEHHLDLVRRLGVVRTPTTLVLDAHGREVSRATGAPRKQDVLAALGNAV